MLPLYLSIEGLYSYQQKQEIDFTQLTEAGLFGIFGTVGSGKSSVLEAISYSLYGETERLNSKEKRTYNMLNLKSNQAIIDFQFLNFEGRKFRFIAQWRRKKKFQEIADHERNAYEWIDGNWVPMESNDGAAITNLSYPNFRRTIIIPQGQFKEFLELKGKDRSEMMKEIFFLNQYDLGPKVSYLMVENNKKIEHLKGALSGFEEVSTEIISEKTVQFQLLTNTLDGIKKEFHLLELQYKGLQIAKQNRLDLVNKQEELASLEQKKNQIQKTELEINEFELITNNFKEHLNNHSAILHSKNAVLTKIEGLKESKDKTKATLHEVEIALDSLLPQYENLDKFKAEVQDIKRLLENSVFTQIKTDKEAGIIKGQEFLMLQKENENQIVSKVNAIENEINKLKQSQINSSELLAIDNWYQKQELLHKDFLDKQQHLDECKRQLEDYKSKFQTLGYMESSWENDIELQIKDLENASEIINNRERDLRVRQELSQYVHNLHDGEACPLCGSLEHPSPMEIAAMDDELEKLNIEKNKLNLDKLTLEKNRIDLQLVSRMIADRILEVAKCTEDITSIQSTLQMHKQSFIWTEFDKDNRAAFETKKNELFKIETQLIQLDSDLKETREQLDKTRETILKSERKLNDYQNEINVLEANIKQNLLQIQVIDTNAYSTFHKDSLEQKMSEINSLIKEIEVEYQEFSKKLLEHRTIYAQIKGAYSEAQEQHAIYSTKLKETQAKLNKLLLDFNYPDIATVKTILDKNLQVSSLRKNVQDFYLTYKALQNRILELESIAKEDNYSEEMFAEIEELIGLKKEELTLQTELYGALKEDLERLTSELEKKKELLSEFEKLNVRKDNLKILDNMFKGNGFVNYVSSIHLQRLCEIANLRFHRLTKNQLSLVINENNEFEVIDYLNNGYRRSAKTLSGGQSFQASLCLALALAENIQSLNKADKNFFFIDEGFGTQDSESINTVFDTLQYLHQENRVVGIISHVEELKERMPRSITVIKDLEIGSQITIN